MKTIIMLISLFASCLNIFSFGGGHDSLLFEGEDYFSSESPREDECGIRALDVRGEVFGTFLVRKSFIGCDGKEIILTTKERRQIKEGDTLMLGEEITTEKGYMKAELYDGSIFYLTGFSHNDLSPGSMKIISEFCQGTKFEIKYLRTFYKIKKKFDGSTNEVVTQIVVNGVRGTEFSVDSDGTTDIIRVYEGVVDVKKMIYNEGSTEKDMEQLAKEFEQGKLTAEEYAQRLMTISQSANQNLKEYMQPVELTPGYQVTATKENITGPEPISGDDRWWEK